MSGMLERNKRLDSRSDQKGAENGLEVNAKSLLLPTDENEIIFGLLGECKCVSLATAVVQLLVADPSPGSEWRDAGMGVACFVKDYAMRKFFIRIYDLDTKSLGWEQELYATFEYRKQLPQFHSFQADSCIAGLNFANVTEADRFYAAIIEKLKARRKKSNDTKLQSVEQIPKAVPSQIIDPETLKPIHEILLERYEKYVTKKSVVKSLFGMLGWGSKSSDPRHKEQPTIEDSNDSESVQDVVLNDKMKKLFKKAKIPESAIKNPEFREAIDDILRKFNVVERARDQSIKKYFHTNITGITSPMTTPESQPRVNPDSSQNASNSSEAPSKLPHQPSLLDEIRGFNWNTIRSTGQHAEEKAQDLQTREHIESGTGEMTSPMTSPEHQSAEKADSSQKAPNPPNASTKLPPQDSLVEELKRRFNRNKPQSVEPNNTQMDKPQPEPSKDEKIIPRNSEVANDKLRREMLHRLQQELPENVSDADSNDESDWDSDWDDEE